MTRMTRLLLAAVVAAAVMGAPPSSAQGPGAAGPGVVASVALGSDASALADGPGTAAARAAIDRLAPRLADRFVLRRLPSGSAADTYRVAGAGSRVVLSGTSQVALVSAFRHWLEKTGHGQISRQGDRLPTKVSVPTKPSQASSPYRIRYAYNMTVAGYQTPYWNWAQWQRELDFLAYSGVNTAHIQIGQEICWVAALTTKGYTRQEVLNWISGTGHLPWQWAANSSAVGPAPTWGLLQRRAELGRKILDRMRALGMTPVVPGYTGIVPSDYALRHPGAVVYPGGVWATPALAPDWLKPQGTDYQEVADAFYQCQQRRFGTVRSRYIAMFHENQTEPQLFDPAGAAKGVQAALQRNVPHWRMVMEGWQVSPLAEIVGAVDPGRMLVVDLTGTSHASRDEYRPQRWVTGVLQNFGQRSPLYGPLRQYATGWPKTLADPGHGRFQGVGITSEGVNTNPVVWSFLTDMFWRRTAPDVGRWMRHFVTARYGVNDSDAQAAWRVLLNTAYNKDNGGTGYGGAFSVLTRKPALSLPEGSLGVSPATNYDARALEPALTYLLRASGRLGSLDTYRYDLVDVARQVIANRGRTLLPKLREAYDARDRARFDRVSEHFLALFDISNRVLSSRREFLLGRWIADARSWGATTAEKDALEQDARELVTTWGDLTYASLQDYANRDWAGLTSGYYKPRWKLFLGQLDEDLALGITRPYPVPPTDSGAQFFPIDYRGNNWYADGERFFLARTAFPATPNGNSLRAVRAAAKQLGLPT